MVSSIRSFFKQEWLSIKNEKYKWVYAIGFVYFFIGMHLIRNGHPGLGTAIVLLSIFGDGYLAKALNDRDFYQKAYHEEVLKYQEYAMKDLYKQHSIK